MVSKDTEQAQQTTPEPAAVSRPDDQEREPAAEPAHARPTPVGLPAAERSVGLERVLAEAAVFIGWLSQPRVRLAVIGMILLVTGGLFMTSSVWTLPLVIVGGLMVAIAWIGRRLNGRFAVQWGQTGTQLEFRAQIKAPGFPQPALPQPALPQPALAPPLSPARKLAANGKRDPDNEQIIDGEAHTVEIELAELEALIAAAQGSSNQIAQTNDPAPDGRSFRVARSDARSPDARR
jgi:hypothetical protein